MRLHEQLDIFKDAVSLTAEYLRLPEIYVEKDYWVTMSLHRIFTSPVAEFVVFKGGTHLAKCHSFIKRFSEDVDLVVVKVNWHTASIEGEVRQSRRYGATAERKTGRVQV